MIVRATNLAEARARVSDGMPPGAGLTLVMTRGPDVSPPEVVLDISGLAELGDIAPDGERLRIGALVPVGKLREHALVRRTAPALARIAGEIGSAPLRRLATVGGNVAWGAGDLVPVLLAHRARLLIGGEETPLETWDRRGLIEAVTISATPFDFAFADKAAHRAAFSPTLVTVSGTARVEAGRLRDVALAIGGGAEPPRRLSRTEAMLDGRTREEVDAGTRAALEEEILRDAADDAAPLRARIAAGLLAAGLRETPS